MFKVFYSWQSDLPSSTNRGLILSSLEKACAHLKAKGGIGVVPVVDRDTLGLSGAPDISDAILAKITDADAFVADVSIVNGDWLPEGATAGRTGLRPTPNPNVLVELGYALATLGNEALVLVANTHFGDVEQLPFDLRSLRVLRYSLRPDENRGAAQKKLEQDFKFAIAGVASVARADPVHAIVYPRTLNVAGQAEAVLRELAAAAGKPFDPEKITEQEIREICESVAPHAQAPLTIGRNAAEQWQYADWIVYMNHWRDRSRKFTSDILVFSPFLSRHHVALLAAIEQSPYFALLENLRGLPISNENLSFLSDSIWKYFVATRQLKAYANKVLARRAETM